MRSILLSLFILAPFAQSVQAQDNSLYQKLWYVKNNDTLPYRLLLPVNYDRSKTYPVVFFLHGAGERGSDNEKQLVHGSALFLRDSIRTKYPAIVVFPQCPQNSFWATVKVTTDPATQQRSFGFASDGPPSKAMELLLDLVDKVLATYPVKKDQVYVGGLSMGGMGTFELVWRKPQTFAAAFAICGGADPSTATKLVQPSWWLFHGLKDDVVPPQYSQVMSDALKAAGANVQLTLYPEASHNSWDSAFAEPDFLHWLFTNKKK